MFSDQCTYNLIGKINDFQSLIVGSSPAMCNRPKVILIDNLKNY